MSDMRPAAQRYVLSDIDIPFLRLVLIFVKWSLAAIPAAIILTLIFMVIGGVMAAVFGQGTFQMRGPGI